jgi:hypothetical protein
MPCGMWRDDMMLEKRGWWLVRARFDILNRVK